MVVARRAVCIHGAVGIMCGISIRRRTVVQVICQMSGKTVLEILVSLGNYVVCTGDNVHQHNGRGTVGNWNDDTGRGIFYPATYDSNNEISSTGCKFAKITDGLSNTIAFSEVMHHREDYANNPNPLVLEQTTAFFSTRQLVSQA